MNRFILASASPRRKELLGNVGIDFEVVVSQADEESVSKELEPSLYVQELALLKAAASAKTLKDKKNTIVIGADTVVTLDGEILGKPADDEDAYSMLKSLSGRVHEVYTGYCIMRLADGVSVCNAVRTEVVFKELTDEKIRRYVATREPADKAGGYGIQGLGGLLVEKINGDYQNVVGLPVSALADTLEKEFDIKIL